MERELARCRNFDFYIHDRGYGLDGYFEYEGGGCQGLGYCVDEAFILGLLQAVGVKSLKELEGKSCWVTHNNFEIERVEPLHRKDGRPFVLKEWSIWFKERNKSKYTIGNIMDLTHPEK